MILVLLVSAAIATPQAPLDGEIRAEVTRYVAAVNGGDARAVAELYERDATASTAGDGHLTLGWDAVADAYADAYRGLRVIRMEIPGDSVTVVPLGEAAALALFPYRWTLGPPGRAVVSRGVMTLVYRRSREGWRIVHDHTSTLVPPGQPASGEASGGGPAAPRRPIENCIVERIVDGDTLVCARLGRVRLIGIDSPEGDQQPFGDQARDALETLVPVGTRLQLEGDVEPRDRYGRRLSYAWREGVLVNWVMVRSGWAVMLTIPPNVQYVDDLRGAQRAAREDRAGLWAVDGFACEPARHRRGEC